MTEAITANFVDKCNAVGSHSAGALNTLLALFVQTLIDSQCALSPAAQWPPDYGAELNNVDVDVDDQEPYDFIVVGAGSAGSVIASRLSEIYDWRVLVLEAGGNPPQESEVPLLFYTLMHTNYTWNYWAETSGRACQAMRAGRCYWPRGRIIGGSGALNAMMYVRGHRGDFDGWLAKGNTGWGWHDVLPYFERSVQRVGNATHPRGYLTLTDFPRDDETYQNMLIAGGEALGVPFLAQFEDGAEVGHAYVKGTLKQGQRMSTGKSHLAKVAGRANLRVIKHAEATRINLDASGKRVESISFKLRRDNGEQEQEFTVRMRKELIVSAGTINSPMLLLQSGIGPREHLSELGIAVRHDLRVGDNLQDHLIVPLFLKLDEGVAPALQAKDTFNMLYEYLMERKGQFASFGTTSLVAFLRTHTQSHNPYPDIEIHYLSFPRGSQALLRMCIDGIGFAEPHASRVLRLVESSNVLVTFILLSHPKSAGSLRLNSNTQPIIDSGYLAVPEDFTTLLRGIRHIEALVRTQPLRAHTAEIAHLPLEECDTEEFSYGSAEYWRCYAKYYTCTCYHHTGTVKMGATTDPTACVDPELRVRGVTNLRVADASIMPDVVSANTNAATIMIAERAADFIKQRWLKPEAQAQAQAEAEAAAAAEQPPNQHSEL